MVGMDALRSEIETLLARIAGLGDGAANAGVDEVRGQAGAAEDPEQLGILRELSAFLADMTDSADETLSAHPYAAAGAAFILGVAVGRLSRF